MLHTFAAALPYGHEIRRTFQTFRLVASQLRVDYVATMAMEELRR